MLRTATTHDDYARSVERLLEGGSAVGLTEAQLVERFAGRRDEAAFAALVDRHGPMVLGVCRRFLRDPNDADDAFQAVFLVLARKAGGLRRKELVANWLHGVARRVASEARRRPRPATPGDESAFEADARRPSPPDPSDAAARDEDGRRLHEEVGRLPERYRAPVVVCYFEGRTHEEAAALLNWPVGTVKGRLARARDLLRARLERRGVTAPAALLATALAAPDLRAAVPPALASRAVAAALAVAASPSAWMTSAALSTSARSLSEGVIQAMFYAQLKTIAIPAALAAGLLAAGAGLAAAGRQAPQEPGEPAPAPAVAQPADAAPAPSTDPGPPTAYVADRPLDVLSPLEVLKLIDEATKDVLQYLKQAEVDLINATPIEAHEEIEHFCDEVNDHIERARSAKVADHEGRSLLDAFADDLATMLDIRNGRLSRSTALKDGEVLDDAYFVFTRSVAQSRRRIARSMDTPDEAKKRHALTLAPVLQGLREPKQEGVSKPLLAAYADYLAAIDPFAEAPAFRRVSADAPPSVPTAAPERPATRRVSDALVEVWQIADNCRKSYEAAIQSAQPAKVEEQAAAMSRHRDRVGQLGKAVRDRAAGDPLLLSLADYLDFRSKSPARGPGGAAIPDLAIDMIARVPGNLQAHSMSAGLTQLLVKDGQPVPASPVDILAGAWRTLGFDPSEFDRQLMLEKLVTIQHRVLEESLAQAEREPEARDLLTRHAEYVRKLLAEVPPPPQPPGPAATDTPPPSTGTDPVATPAAPDEAPPTFARADLSLSPEEVLDLIDGTGKAVVQRMKESEVDLAGASTTQEALEVVDHLCDEVDEHVRRLRSAKVAEPNGRALLDAFADSLARLLQMRGGKEGPGVGPVQDAEALDEPYLVFRRSVNRARLQAAGGPQAREAAGRRHRSTIAPILKALREPTQQPITKPLLAAYADYLEAIDPFAEAPAFRPASADAPASQPPDAQERPASRSVSDVLDFVWNTAADYQKSYQAVLQFNQPAKAEEWAAAMARHLDRLGRLGKAARDRAAGDPLLLSLADYLDARSKSSVTEPGEAVVPETALIMIANVRANLAALLDQSRSGLGPDSSEFDRELLREKLAWPRDYVLADSLRLAERDEAARDLLIRHAEYVKKLLSDYAALLPPPKPVAAAAAPRPTEADAAADPTAGQAAEAPGPSAVVPDRILLDVTWRTAEQYRKSLDTATRPAMGKPQDDPKAAEARARHLRRIGRLADDLQSRSAGEPLLTSLAAFLAANSKAAHDGPIDQADSGGIQTLPLILMARDNLEQVRFREQKPGWLGQDDFDRSLVRERVIQAMESTFDDLARQAEKDARSRDFLARFTEVLTRYMQSDEYLFPGPAAVAPSPSPDPAESVAPAPAPPSGGGSDGPSPAESRQKVAGLAATLAGVDDDPSNRKVHDALDRPAALKAAGKSTLGELIEQVKKALKDEDGSPIPIYVDPRGLDDAAVTLDSPATIDLEGVPLKFSLRLVLKQLGLAYCVRDGVLIVSSLEGVEQELLEAQREMMGAHPDRFILGRDGTIRPAAGTGGGMGGMGGGMSQPGGMM